MKDEEIHKEAIERFEVIETRERDQRKLAVEDMLFANAEDGQWEEDAIEKRSDRPRYTINKVAGAIDQIVGDQRQGRTNIKVRPVAGGASEDIANIFNGIIRNIEAQSKASNSYDCAFDETLTGGFGGWRVITEFDDSSFNQEIKIKPIKSAATSLWFGHSLEYDKRDASHAFLTVDMPITVFKEKFPDAIVTDFNTDQMAQGSRHWFRENVVRVAEYWKKIPVKKEIALLSDGRIIDIEEEKQVLDELEATGITIVKQRKVNAHKVVMYKMSGGEILEGPKDWAGKFIPLIPEFGKTSNIEGEELTRGIVRFAKDPSRIYNYATSASIEAAALSPKDPIWMTPAMAKGHKEQLKSFGQKNQPFMFFNIDPESPSMIPQRGGAPAVQSALMVQIQQAGMDIHATTGLEPASLGNVPELKSGKAILAQQAMGDRGAFIFTDNHHKSIQYCGDILVDLIPKIMDTEQMVRVLHIDGTSEDTAINQASLSEFGETIVDQQTGQAVMVNDITIGKYDVVVDAGPAYHTQREESAQQLIDLASASPIFEQVATDLIAKNLNVLENDELTKRIRRQMIMQGIVEPTDDEVKELGLDQPQEPAPDPNMVIAQAEMKKADADVLAQQNKSRELGIKEQEMIVKQEAQDLKESQVAMDERRKDEAQEVDEDTARADNLAKEARAERDYAEAEQTREETAAMKTGVNKLLEQVNGSQ